MAETYPEIDRLTDLLQKAGLTEADGAKLYKAKVEQGFLIGCLNAGITDVKDIILLSDAGVSDASISEYRELGVWQLTASQMVRLHDYNITPRQLTKRHGKRVTDADIESYIDALEIAEVDPRDLDTFETCGITDPKVIAELIREGVTADVAFCFTRYGNRATPEELADYSRLHIEPSFLAYLYNAGYQTPEKVAEAHQALLNNGSLRGYSEGCANLSRLGERREDAVKRYGKLGEQLFDIHPWPRHILRTLNRSAKLADEMQNLDDQTLLAVVNLVEENQEASAEELRGLISFLQSSG